MPTIKDEGVDITGKCNCSRHFKKVVLIANKYVVYFLENGDVYCEDGDICAKCGTIMGREGKTAQSPCKPMRNNIYIRRCPSCSEEVKFNASE